MGSCRAGTCDGGERGFTLVELLVVLGILAISVSYVALRLPAGDGAEVRGAARRLLYTARRLSDEAQFTRAPRVLEIDLDRGEYGDREAKSRSRLPSHVVVARVTIGTEAATSGVVSITAFPSGFRDEAAITLASRGGQRYTVAIPALGERFELREE